MAWGWLPDGNMWCTGCGGTGGVPCPVDHDNEPPNESDEDGWYFRCPECGYLPGCGVGGTVPCPECEAGGRRDTFQDDEEDDEELDDLMDFDPEMELDDAGYY